MRSDGPFRAVVDTLWRLPAVAALGSTLFVALMTGAKAAEPNLGLDPEYLLRKWETDEGLPENSATAIVQSPQGYLWIGTFSGLVRFDGVQFTVFDQANTPQLPSSGIVNLHFDGAGRLWVSTLGGMAMLEADRWRTFSHGDGWAGDFARTFSERANGDLLVTTFDGQVLEFSDDRFTSLPAPPGERGKGYFGFADEAGRWCVVQHGFVGSWDGRRWQEIFSPGNVSSGEVATARARGGGQWILLGRDLYRYRDGKHAIHRTLQELSGGIWSIFEDSAGNLWICSFDAGLYRVDAPGNMRRWTTDNGLTFNGVRCVFEDRERNLWIGTSGGGLMQFAKRRAGGLGEAEGLAGRVVNSVSTGPDGNLWIATYDKGVFCGNGDEIKPVPLFDGHNRAILAQSVLADSRGRVWVGTYGEGLWRIDGEQATRIPDANVGDGNILALFEDSRGRVWFGGGHRIAKLEAGEFQIFGPEQGLPDGGATCFAENRSGTIWLANRSRVFRLAESRLNEVVDERGKSIQDVLCLYADDSGGMWMGLERGGLLRSRDDKFARVFSSNGLAADSVQSIVDDGRGALWMTTNRGLLRIGMDDLEAAAQQRSAIAYHVLDKSDGLPNDQFPFGRQPVSGRDNNGRLWFATQKGVATVDPAGFELNAVPPPAVLEEFVYHTPSRDPPNRVGRNDDESETRLRLPSTVDLVLPPGSRRIEIHYTGLSFAPPSRIRFQTRLDGWDNRWQNADAQRVVHYHELAPGDYVFYVRASNNDGIWSSEDAQLAFTVLPFYWQTIWFRSATALLLVVASSAAAWWAAHVRQQRRRRQELELARQRNALAHLSRVSMLGELSASLAHELNQPLTAILANAQAALRFLAGRQPSLDEVREILGEIVEDNNRAGDVILRLRSLFRRDQLVFEPVDVAAVVSGVAMLVHSDAVLRHVELDLQLEANLPAVRGDKVQLQQVVLNLMLNAFDVLNHLPEGDRRVIVQAQTHGQKVVKVCVRDNGPGLGDGAVERIFEPFFTTKETGMGMGLSISRSIVEAHGGALSAQNNPDCGAVFWFTLPIDELADA